MNDGSEGQLHQHKNISELVLAASHGAVSVEEAFAKKMKLIQTMKEKLLSVEEGVETEYQQYIEKKEQLKAEVKQGQLAAQRLKDLEDAANTDPARPWQTPLHPQPVQQYTELPSTAKIVEVPSPKASPQYDQPPASSSQRYTNSNSAPTYPSNNVSSSYGSGSQNRFVEPRGSHFRWNSHTPSIPQSYGFPTSNPQSHPFQTYTGPFQAYPSSSSQSHTSHHNRQQPSSASNHFNHRAPQSSSNVPPARQARGTSYAERAGQANVPQSAKNYPMLPSGIPLHYQQHFFSYMEQLSAYTQQATMVLVLMASERREAGRAKTDEEIHMEANLDPNIVRNAETIAEAWKTYKTAQIQHFFSEYSKWLNRQGQTSSVGQAQPVQTAPPQPIFAAASSTSAQAQVAPVQANGPLPPQIQSRNQRAHTAVPPTTNNTSDTIVLNGSAPLQTTPAQHVTAGTIDTIAAVVPAQAKGTNSLQTAPAQHLPTASNGAPAEVVPVRSHNTLPANPQLTSSTTQMNTNTIGNNVSRPAPSSSTRPLRRLPWYNSNGPNSLLPYSDDNGKVYWLPPHAVPHASSPHAAPQAQPAPSATSGSSKIRPPPLAKSKPSNSKPSKVPQPSSWTPQQANRSRLAQDIMRSLGRPQGAFGAPLVGPHNSFVPWFEVIDPPSGIPKNILDPPLSPTGKRKALRSPSVSPVMEAKRPRHEEEDMDMRDEENAMPLTMASATTNDGQPDAITNPAVPASEPEQGNKAPTSLAVVEPLPPTPAAPSAVEPAGVNGDAQAVEALIPDAPDAEGIQAALEMGMDVTEQDVETVQPDHGLGPDSPNSELALAPNSNLAPSSEPATAPSSELALAPTSEPATAPNAELSTAPNSEPTLACSLEPAVSIDKPTLPADSYVPWSDSSNDVVGSGPGADQFDRYILDTNIIPLIPVSPSYPPSPDGSRATPPPQSASESHESEREIVTEKLPLFLPSPSPSVDVQQGDITVGVFPAADSPRVPRHLKGKERAVDEGLGNRNDDMLSKAGVATITGVAAQQKRRRVNRAYVLVPPLPGRSIASTSRLADASARLHWPANSAFEPEGAQEDVDVEAEEARKLSSTRLRRMCCSWAKCGAILNSTYMLEKHVVLHASEHEGRFACHWDGCDSPHLVHKRSILKHLLKHARSQLWCAYEDCNEWFLSSVGLLRHHHSRKHQQPTRPQDGQLRQSCLPAPAPERTHPLSPLPDRVPAYMSVDRRVGRHPISSERHQWLGPKVLENITSFKYTGRRSNAALPPRGSRRLAEKVAAAELAALPPESALEQIRRWIDYEYLDFADGYNGPQVCCTDIPSAETTQLVDDGMILPEDRREEEEEEEEEAGREHEEGREKEALLDVDGEVSIKAEENQPPPIADGSSPKPKIPLPRRQQVAKMLSTRDGVGEVEPPSALPEASSSNGFAPLLVPKAISPG